jgi:hypothetical protein
MGNCAYCFSEIPANNYGRQDTCDQCGRDTRICINCVHHDRAYNNQCKESQADRIVEKERSNFCDYFVAKSQSGNPAATKDAIKAAADALFKKK